MAAQIFLGVLVPALLTATFLLVVSFLSGRARGTGESRGTEWAWGPALALALLAAFLAEEGWPNWPGSPRWHALPACAAVAAAGGVMAGRVRFRGSAWVWLAATSAACTALLRALPGLDGAAAAAAVAACLLSPGAMLLPLARTGPGGAQWILGSCMALAGISGLALEARFAKLAIICGGLSAACGLAAVAGHVRRLPFGAAGAVALSTLTACCAATGYAYGPETIPAACWVLPLCGPLALWLSRLRGVRRWRPVVQGAMCVAAAGVISGSGLAWLQLHSAAPASASSSDPYPVYP